MIIDEVKQNIIAELGLEKLPREKADEVMTKLEENIQRKVVLEILELLKPEDQKELIKIVEPGNNQNISSFLADKIPMDVVESLIKAISESFVKEFKNSVK